MTEVTDVDLDPPGAHQVPRLTEGVSLCGVYEGGGYEEPRYLIARGDGQMVLVSPVLYFVAEVIDGVRDLGEVAEAASERLGKQISVPGVAYLVDEKLHSLGIATTTEPLAAPPNSDPLIRLQMRGVLLPPRVVRALGALLAPLFYPVVIVFVVCALIATDVVLLSSGRLDAAFHQSVSDPTHVLVVMALIVTSTLFHETGHAAGCHYGGARPGAIGVGILLIFPCFFTNVTDAYRLDQRGRLRTDLGGIYFNAIYILAAAGVYAWTAYPPLLVFIVLSHLQILQQLMPLIRLDGYYILGDLVGVPNLFSQVRPFIQRLTGRHRLTPRANSGLRPRVQIIVSIWVLIAVPTLCYALTMMLWRLPGYAATAWANGQRLWNTAVVGFDHAQTGLAIVAILSLLVLILPWVGGIVFVGRTVKKVGQVSRRRRRKKASLAARHRQAVSTWMTRASRPRDPRGT